MELLFFDDRQTKLPISERRVVIPNLMKLLDIALLAYKISNLDAIKVHHYLESNLVLSNQLNVPEVLRSFLPTKHPRHRLKRRL